MAKKEKKNSDFLDMLKMGCKTLIHALYIMGNAWMVTYFRHRN